MVKTTELHDQAARKGGLFSMRVGKGGFFSLAIFNAKRKDGMK